MPRGLRQPVQRSHRRIDHALRAQLPGQAKRAGNSGLVRSPHQPVKAHGVEAQGNRIQRDVLPAGHPGVILNWQLLRISQGRSGAGDVLAQQLRRVHALLLQQQLVGGGQRQLRGGLTRQNVQHPVEELLRVRELPRQQRRHPGVPLEAPVFLQPWLQLVQQIVGLARLAHVQQRAHHRQRNLHGVLQLRLGISSAQGIQQVPGLGEAGGGKQAVPRVLRIGQRGGKGADNLRHGDLHGAHHAVDQLVGAEHNVLSAERTALRGEPGVQVRVVAAVADSQDLPQHADQLVSHGGGGAKARLRILVRGPQQQAVQGQILAEQRFFVWGGQPRGIHSVFHRQVHDQCGQGAADGVDVAGHGRSGLGNLRGLETLGAEDVPERADACHRTQVDQLHLVLGDQDVVRLQVVVDHAAGVQVVQCGQDLQDVANRHVQIQHPGRQLPPLPAQRWPADVLHHDEAAGGAWVVDEVENLHDSRVRDVRQERPLGFRDRAFLLVFRGHHAFEHHVAVGDVVVDGDVHPAQTAVRDGAEDLVLACDDVAGLQCRCFHAFLDRRAGVNDCVFRVRRRDERKLHHAVGHGGAGAVRAAPLAERR